MDRHGSFSYPTSQPDQLCLSTNSAPVSGATHPMLALAAHFPQFYAPYYAAAHGLIPLVGMDRSSVQLLKSKQPPTPSMAPSSSLPTPPSTASLPAMPQYPLAHSASLPLPASKFASDLLPDLTSLGSDALFANTRMIKDVFFTDPVAHGGMPLSDPTTLTAGPEVGEVALHSIFEVDKLSPPSSPSKFDQEDNSSLFGCDLDSVMEDGSVDSSLAFGMDAKAHQALALSPRARVLTPPNDDGEPDSDMGFASLASPASSLASSLASPDFPSDPSMFYFDKASSGYLLESTKRRRLNSYPTTAAVGHIQTVSPSMLMHSVLSPDSSLSAAGALAEFPADLVSAEESGDDEYVPPEPTASRTSRRSPKSRSVVGIKRSARASGLDTPKPRPASASPTPLASTPKMPRGPAVSPRLATPEPTPVPGATLPDNQGRALSDPRATHHPTLYEEMTQANIDWCRYCGTTEGINWRPGPWGKRTLCNKHGCDYKGYGFACKLPRLDLRAYVNESIGERDRPILQLYCTVCHDAQSYEGNVLVRCEGCPKAYHQNCYSESISDAVVQGGEAWFCDGSCPHNCRSKRVVVELPRKRLPLMCTPKATPVATPEPEKSKASALTKALSPRLPSARRARRTSYNVSPVIQLPPSPSPSVGEVDSPSDTSDTVLPTSTFCQPRTRTNKKRKNLPAIAEGSD
ncbi:hypothetical protein H4R34_005351 [Dimargaris verticillata]|uniref:PHD-type domain-containing protein n=1 Tax=Dimargaris verticillata TaxID=2761393 RepID=A0A9W8AX28_9FUNG|nr:hypothetical protein H4R34_005351 [Dimargaris verticillata]